MQVEESELVLNPDGSVYHLKLKPEHIANDVILVGDPGRVALISSRFDSIECQIENREFVTHTGHYRGKRFTVLATGIGTDNIDIVVNELDAAINFDLSTRTIKEDLRRLNLVRIGTCGGLQPDLEADTAVVSEFSIGLDGVAHYYDLEYNEHELRMLAAYKAFTTDEKDANPPYVAQASPSLVNRLRHIGKTGVTLTANGFFGPQGRRLRLPIARPDFNAQIDRFEYGGRKILNYEMESSALFALGKALGHHCACICLVVANRKAQSFSTRYQEAMKDLIDQTLDALVASNELN